MAGCWQAVRDLPEAAYPAWESPVKGRRRCRTGRPLPGVMQLATGRLRGVETLLRRSAVRQATTRGRAAGNGAIRGQSPVAARLVARPRAGAQAFRHKARGTKGHRRVPGAWRVWGWVSLSYPGEVCVGHICDLEFAELPWTVRRPSIQI